MHALANPARFLRIARPTTSWLLVIGIVFAIAGMAAGLTLTPPDYLQGETVRIMYIHVPAAWLGMAGWLGIAAASFSQLVWRHPLAAVGGRAVAPAGATFASASSARMRISVAAPNRQVNPTSVIGSGQRIDGSIVEPVRVMLSPW